MYEVLVLDNSDKVEPLVHWQKFNGYEEVDAVDTYSYIVKDLIKNPVNKTLEVKLIFNMLDNAGEITGEVMPIAETTVTRS